MTRADRGVAMGLLFYPRGGSAQVVRYLCPQLKTQGWPVTLACGSLGAPGERTNASTFYDGIDVVAMDYTAAVDAFDAGRDPIAVDNPIHPSLEERPDVADRVFAAVSPSLGDHLVDAWGKILSDGWESDPAIIHLHHLTPMHEAAYRTWPNSPVVTHLHGTELKMLKRIERLAAIAQTYDTDLAGMADLELSGALPDAGTLLPEQRHLFEQTRWHAWRYGEHWHERLCSAAHGSKRLIVVSPHDKQKAIGLLGVDERRIEHIPDGVDTDLFDRQPISAEERMECWRRWLVEDPRGWDESGRVGSIVYRDDDLSHFIDSDTGEPLPVLLFVGRFLNFKRVPLLVRAYARARPRFRAPVPLVVWGGFPGEWEGEHPYSVACNEQVEGVFFTGWRGHRELPRALSCADVFVAPSHNEPFGQVFLEAMACGLPVIGTRSGGPVSFVNVERSKPNGWLVTPDDIDDLADALVEAVNSEDERRRRAENAYNQIRASYSWSFLASRFVAIYEEALGVN